MNICRQIKKERGVTLTELLIVISIVAILAVSLGFSFQGWMGRYRVESQASQMYADIMAARTMAMTRNMMHFVVLNANNYVIYEDTNDNNVPEPGSGPTDDHPIAEFCVPGTFNVRPKPVQYSLGWTGNSTISFNTRGIASAQMTIDINAERSCCLSDTCDEKERSKCLFPDYDCISIRQSRVRMAKNNGTNCVEK